MFDLAEWKHLPALPPPSVQVSEVKADPDRSAEEEGILEMHHVGRQSFKTIAAQMKDLQGREHIGRNTGCASSAIHAQLID